MTTIYEAFLPTRGILRPRPRTSSKPWRPPPYANLLPPNTTITTTDVSTNRRGAGAINCASIFGATTARGHAQVSEQVNDGTGGLFTSDRKDRGHVGPQKQHKRHNNQSVCGRGNAGVKNVCNNTTISRAGWKMRQKITNILSSRAIIAARITGKQTQQPTGLIKRCRFERMQLMGGEGGHQQQHNNHRRL